MTKTEPFQLRRVRLSACPINNSTGKFFLVLSSVLGCFWIREKVSGITQYICITFMAKQALQVYDSTIDQNMIKTRNIFPILLPITKPCVHQVRVARLALGRFIVYSDRFKNVLSFFSVHIFHGSGAGVCISPTSAYAVQTIQSEECIVSKS